MRDGKTALHLAATDKRVNPSVAKLLIQHGADVNAKDNEGRTPLSLACGETANPQTAQLLREMGAQMD
jgi:ankyrin repeat protein